MSIRTLVALHDSTGVIQFTQEDTGNYGVDGTVTEDGLVVHRIWDLYGDASVGEFMDSRLWDEPSQTWRKVTARPNGWSYWDTTNDCWAWDVERVKSEVRAVRDGKLALTDWVVLSDVTVDETFKQNMLEYRQALRDITETLDWTQISRVDDVVWPEMP